jgi:hypothetical protein
VLIQIKAGISDSRIDHSRPTDVGCRRMKQAIAALSVLATISPVMVPVMAEPAEVVQMFDCSAFTHILWACLPPSSARDTADAMTSAFMSAGIKLGRERHMSDGKLNAVAMAALQRQRANAGNTCRFDRLDGLVRSHGKFCDALIESHRAEMEGTEAARRDRGT